MSEAMGTIYVDVQLTNAVDAVISHRGELPPESVRSCKARAMVDTGAIRSVVPASIIEQLGIEVLEESVVQLADGSRQTVPLAGPVLLEVEGRKTFEEVLVLGEEVLIGQTVLEKLDFLADCARQQLVPAHPEGPISIVK